MVIESGEEYNQQKSMKIQPKIRDIIAMPFVLIAFLAFIVASYVGSTWTANEILKLFKHKV